MVDSIRAEAEPKADIPSQELKRPVHGQRGLEAALEFIDSDMDPPLRPPGWCAHVIASRRATKTGLGIVD